METNNSVGGDFDDFLREQEMLSEVEGVALKRLLALQIGREVERA